MRNNEARFDLRCEWGEAGVIALASASDVIVVVDVLSFSTWVDIAVSRRGEILPFPERGPGAEEFAQRHRAALARSRGEGRYSPRCSMQAGRYQNSTVSLTGVRACRASDELLKATVDQGLPAPKVTASRSAVKC